MKGPWWSHDAYLQTNSWSFYGVVSEHTKTAIAWWRHLTFLFRKNRYRYLFLKFYTRSSLYETCYYANVWWTLTVRLCFLFTTRLTLINLNVLCSINVALARATGYNTGRWLKSKLSGSVKVCFLLKNVKFRVIFLIVVEIYILCRNMFKLSFKSNQGESLLLDRVYYCSEMTSKIIAY